MGSVNISPLLAPRIQAQAYARNGQVAPAIALADVAAAVNQCAALCGKELFTAGGDIAHVISSQGAGPYTQLRGRIHTGPFCDKIRWYLTLARPDHGTVGASYAVMELQNTSGSALATGTAYWGRGTDTGLPDSWGTFAGDVDAAADTDYLLEFKLYNDARIANVLVHELALAADTANGYIAPPTNLMLDDVRGASRLALYNLYRRAGAVVLSWTGALSNATNTDTNVVDGSSTTVTAATPGFTLDMSYKARQRDATAGVNCTIFVYGSLSTGSGGAVRIKDSTGAILATVTGFSATPGWKTQTLALPATLAKYDLTAAAAIASTISISAIAVLEHET